MNRIRTAMLATMEAETSHLLAGAIARGAQAMDIITAEVLAAVRRGDSFDAVQAALKAPESLMPQVAAAPLLVALSAGMVTGDLLGRYQVIREVGGQGVTIAPIGHAFGEEPRATSHEPRFADLGEISLDPLPPTEAIDYFRAKVPLTTTAFEEISDIYRGRAFTIAKQQTVEAVQVVQDWLTKSLSDGLTFREFLSGLNEAAAAGGISTVNPYHAATVFQTNIQTAYNAGRWEMYNAPEVVEAFPYFQYHTVGDDRVRPTHAQMDGFIAKRDDPVWDLWWPPNGYNCAPAGTLITTARGPVAIEDIRHGDLVMTHRGRWQPVVELHRNRYVGELVRVRVGGGRQFDVTPNHEFFTEAGWLPAASLNRVQQLPDLLDPGDGAATGSVIARGPAGGEIEHANPLAFDVFMPPPTRRPGGFEELHPDAVLREKEADPERLDQVVPEDLDTVAPDIGAEHVLGGGHLSTGIGMRHGFSSMLVDLGQSQFMPDLRAPGARSPAESPALPSDPVVGLLRESSRPVAIGSGRPIFPIGTAPVDVHDPAAHGEGLLAAPVRIVRPLGRDGVAPVPDRDSEEPKQSGNRPLGIHPERRADLSKSLLLREVHPAQHPLDWLPESGLDLGDHACALRLHGQTVSRGFGHVKIESLRRVPFEGTVYNLGVAEDESYCIAGVPVHNCRCTVTAISKYEVQDSGIRTSSRFVPQPDPGFAGNAAQAIRTAGL